MNWCEQILYINGSTATVTLQELYDRTGNIYDYISGIDILLEAILRECGAEEVGVVKTAINTLRCLQKELDVIYPDKSIIASNMPAQSKAERSVI